MSDAIGMCWRLLCLGLALLFATTGEATAQQASCPGAGDLHLQDGSVWTQQQSHQPVRAQAEGEAYWKPMEGPYGAHVTALISPSDSVLIAHAGFSSGSPTYRSIDNGASWTRLRIPGSELAKPPTSEGTVFIAGREGLGWSLQRSSDLGATWKQLSFNPDSVDLNARYGGYFFDLAAPSDSTILAGFFAREEIATHCPDYETALVYSTDGGQSWHRADTYFDKGSTLATDSEGNVYVARDNYVFRSTDGGKTWNQLNQERTLFGNLIDFAAASPDTLFVIRRTANNPTTTIRRSFNGGTTWEKTARKFQNAYVLAVSPDEALYVGAEEGVYRSADAGSTFEQVGQNAPAGTRALAFSAEGTTFSGAKLGPYLLQDPNGVWTLQSTGMQRRIRLLAQGKRDGILYAGAQNSIAVSDDEGDTWEAPSHFPHGLSEMMVTSEEEALAIVGRLYRTTSQGQTWRRVEYDTWLYTPALVQKPNGSILGLTLKAAYRSTDGGASWEPYAEFGEQRLRSINELSAATDDTIFAATGLGMKRSTDGGRSWSLLENGLPIFQETGAAKPIKNVLAISASEVVAAAEGQIYHSEDGGASWTNVQEIGGGKYVFIEGPEGALYATGGEKIYVSEDRGRKWEAEASNPQDLPVNDLAFDGQGHLLAGTRRGIYRSQEPVAIDLDEAGAKPPQSIVLHANVPNPFHNETRIAFAIDRPQAVSLTVYDMLGRQVATLLNETRLETGKHAVRFQGEGHASGAYVVQLHAGGTVKTQRLLLVR